MASAPAVSVIIPTYNRAALLREALDSVAAQTFADYEVIVVDDGSTEDLSAVTNGHATRPRVFRQAQQGPAEARNRGIAEARGGLIAFLDSDDLWLPTKLERFVERLRANSDINIVYGPMAPIDAMGRRVPGRTKPCHGGRITERLFCSSFVHVPTVVCRAEVLRRVGGFNPDLPVCEDYDLWLRLSVTEAFDLIDEPLALRRLHDNRLSKSSMSRNLAVKAKMLEDFYASEPARHAVPRDIADRRLARVCFSAGRAALRCGQGHRANEFFRASRSHGTSGIRMVPMTLAANVVGLVERFISDAPETPANGTPKKKPLVESHA